MPGLHGRERQRRGKGSRKRGSEKKTKSGEGKEDIRKKERVRRETWKNEVRTQRSTHEGQDKPE